MSQYSGRSAQGENMLRALHFDHPRWTPVSVWFLPACRAKYGPALDEVLLRHPRLFPSYDPATQEPAGAFYDLYVEGRATDCWGCVWENLHGGMVGQVTGHPLADWSHFDAWKASAPDPATDGLLGPRDWDAVRRDIARKKEKGRFSPDHALSHGFHYMLLCDLRGFENVMMDMAVGEPRLDELIDVIVGYNQAVTRRLLDCGTEFMGLAEDLGMQHSLPISAELWRRYVKPGYEATAGQARDRGIPVFLHSDGHILPILGDLYETGIRMVNPQVRANGLDGLRDTRGELAICLDLDRQLFPFAAPEQLERHVRECHEALHRPEGGLMLNVEMGQDVSLESMEVLFNAVEDVCNLPEPEETGGEPTGF